MDGEGTVFFTDELRNVIMKVRAEDFATGTAKPEVVYDGSTVTEVTPQDREGRGVGKEPIVMISYAVLA